MILREGIDYLFPPDCQPRQISIGLVLTPVCKCFAESVVDVAFVNPSLFVKSSLNRYPPQILVGALCEDGFRLLQAEADLPPP